MKDFLSKLIEKDIHIDLVEGGLSIKFPKKGIDQTMLQYIKDRKQEIIDYLNNLKAGGFVEIPVISLQDSYPISDAQRRLWVLSQFEGGSVAYNIPGRIYLNQDIEIGSFKRAIDATIERNEILRTVFKEDESGEIRQWVLEREELGFSIDYQDLRKEANKKAKAEAYIAADAYRAFDLAKGPLLRAALLQVEEVEYVFYFNMHHIISDGWSMEVLSKDVFKYYKAYQSGKALQLKELRIQYKDYSAWQLAQLNGESFKAHKEYWLDKLSGELPLLDLPSTKQRPKVMTYNGHGLATYLGKATTAKLKGYVQENGGSLFMGLLASWNVLMYRYTSQRDIIIGTPVAGRDHADLEDQIGFYVNTLVLRNEVDPEESFDSFYQTLKENTIESYNHQMYPFDRLVEELELQRDTSRSAVFDVMLTLQNNGERIQGVELSEEELNHTIDQGYSRSKFDLEVTAQEVGDYLSLNVVFNPDVYEKAMVEGLIGHYKQLLTALLENPRTKISKVDYLSEGEKHKLLVTFNDTAVAYPKDKTIVDLFEEQAAKTPDNVAVVFEDRELTYRELHERSNQLAHYLRDNYDIQPDDLVGIIQSRSEWMIVSILGVLKSSGAYVPIDPDYPQERIDFIEQDTNCKVCLDETTLREFKESQVSYSKEPIASNAKGHHMAYVIYTSGSTGKPKGVTIEHNSLINLIVHQGELFEIQQEERILLFSKYTFDASLEQQFLALCNGATLVVISEDLLLDTHRFAQFVNQQQITHLHATPSFLEMLIPGDYIGLKRVIAGGEECNEKLAKRWSELIVFYNEYGPTETTITATITAAALHKNGMITIGKPLPNLQIYILEKESQQLVPFGVAGEICIGGAGLARGYLNQPSLTAEKFIESPFKEGERLYRTGDLGRWLPDGSIEFIGRRDDQVKIRGYRIELGEIQHTLLKYEAVDQAVVLARANESGEKDLVAYITSNVEQNTSDLRGYLKEQLPAYMVPAYFVQLEAMPLTANGKIDKKSLPDPEGLGLSSGVEYVAPGTEQEKVLALVWSDVLKRAGISVKDSFYNLGGDSIKSIQVVARLKQHGYRLKVEHLLRTPILEELAKLMELATQFTDQREVSGEVALTPIQEWFFKAEEIKVHDHFNQSVLLHSKEQLDSKLLEKSIEDLTRHHDALRMVYQQREGAWQQFNQDTRSKIYTLDFYDLREVDDALRQMARLGEKLQSSIKLSEGLLLKVLHFRLKDGDRLGLIIHHLVVDGVSWRILLEDLSSLYSGYKEGEKPGLPLKTDSFQRWALLQKEYAASKKLARERQYWQAICDQQIAGLPQDKTVKEGQVAVIDSSESFGLDKTTTGLLQTRVHGVYNTEINDVLLASLGLALKEVLSVDKSVLQMEGHGREEIIDGVDISRTVGWFTTIYPFVLNVSNSSNQTESLVAVKEDLRSVPNKGIGYGILTRLSKEGLESTFTPEITFNYLGDFGANVSNDKDSLFEYASERIGSDISKENGTDAILDISGMLVRGELGMSIRYSKSRYHAATIKKLAASYKKNLKVIIEELAKSKETYLTPSDLSFRGLSQEELSKLNSDNTMEDVYELSPLQEGIYYHWLAEDSSSLYFEQISYRVRAKVLDIEKLKVSYDRLTARHAVLRTSFSTEYAGRSLQIVRKEVPSNFTYEKLDSQADREGQVELIKQQDRERGFDLSSYSQMRLHIIDLSEGEYEFIWSHHHILMDGWCGSVLINDFNELLIAATAGRELNLAPALPYSNYINWLRAMDRDCSLRYWKDYLSGYSSLAEIPFKAETGDTTYVESIEHLQIGGDMFKKVDSLCTQLGITHNTFVQGVWGYLLSRYNNTNDVVFGAVVSGRPADLPGVEDMIGLFINTIPVRVKYDPDDTPVKLLRSLQEQSIQGTSHHYMNLSEVQSQSELGMALMNHVMIFENYAVKELESEGVLNTQSEEGLSIESMEVFERTNYDFNLTIAPSSVSLEIHIAYNTNHYDKTGLKHLINHLDKLINEFVRDANQSLRTIAYLSEEEEHRLLFTFNDTAVAYPKDKTIVDLFEEQAAKTPDNVAVVFENRELTYRELDERSNQLAHYLREDYGIRPDDLVGIVVGRSELMIITLLAVLKSGGAYLPIDPEYSADRVAHIIKDSGVKTLFVNGEIALEADGVQRVSLSDIDGVLLSYPATNISRVISGQNLAYVIYTSASTGQPKGVKIEHKNLINVALSWRNAYGLQNMEVKLLQMASMSFDVFTGDVCRSILNGGTLVICPSSTRLDLEALYDLLSLQRINIVESTPALLVPLVQYAEQCKLDLSFVKLLIIGSDTLLVEDYKNIIKYVGATTRVLNSYGVTEATIDSSYYESTLDGLSEKRSVPIGKPLHNIFYYILDRHQELVPIGVAGELYIGGSGVGRGYINLEALTRERFLPNPFKEGERLYRTGDLGRWLPDGNIEFIGRKDDQVKIRGHRIELGEIEYALAQHEQIEQVVVVVKATESGEKELVAYLTSNAKQNINDLRAYLKETLPAYMVPAHFVQLESMPLTANGKVDRKSLPDPEGLGLASGVDYVAPRNETEEKLVKIWEGVLQRANIGVNDDFFALGGHSLKAVRLSNEYQKELGVKLALKDLFAHTSVASHAALIASSDREAFVQIEKVTLQASYPISDAQRRLWVLSQFEGGSVAYNMPDHTYLNQDVEIENFKRAIDATIERHEILRTVIRGDESGEIRQWILERKDLGFSIDYQDFRKEVNKKAKAEAYIAADANLPFNLEKGPLLRAALLQIDNKEYVFCFNMHHIISDGWSMELLSKDVFKYYEAYRAGKEPEVKELRIQYKDYSAWQLAQLNGDSFKAHKEYWLDKLSVELLLLDLPSTKQRPKVMTYNGQGLAIYLDKATTAKLKGYVQGNGGSLFMALLASWNVLMYRYTSQTDIIIGTPVAGRDHADLEDQIGFYVNTLALRNEINPEASFDNFYQSLKENTLESYSHQMYPFDRLVEGLNLQRDTSRGAVFDVMFTLQNNGERIQAVELSEEELNQTIDQGYSTSKFDLDITGQEVGDYLSLNVVFNPDVYEQSMIEGLLRHYKQLLTALLENPRTKISQVDYLSEEEKHKLLVAFNDTAIAYPKDKTIIDLFEEQAAKRPDNVAVVFEDRELTYRELDERSNQLAHYLRGNYDIRPDDLVGIKQSRSEWMIVSILGVLKSGGAYVPIDPDYPQKRIAYIEADTQCKVCVDKAELSKFQESQESYSKEPVTSTAKGGHLAYVIYTSGSTGKPKGVMVSHQNLTNKLIEEKTVLSIDNNTVSYCLTSYVFDVSLLEIFLALIAGGKTIAPATNTVNNPEATIKKIIDYKVTTLQGTPTYFAQFVSELTQETAQELNKVLKTISVGGESLNANLIKNMKALLPNVKLNNHYGPTEITIDAIISEDVSSFEANIIGKPLGNTAVYILDGYQKLVTVNVTGEILISGPSVAQGYLNQSELTNEKFIANPFKEGERLYKTGDLGRWLPDGNIEYLGRKDDQVKIRGYRIELGEVEHALSQVEGIKHACVLSKERTTGAGSTKFLVGYYELDKQVELKQSTILEKLSLILPEYMVPSTLIEMQAFPLTINGKLNRRALPDPDFISSEEYVAPTTETEIALVKIWQDVLGVERVGVTDNFFLIGGNSILAIQASHQMRIAMGVDVKVADVFRLKSIQKISLEKDFSGVKLYQSSYNSNLANLIFVPPGRAGSEMYQGLADLLKAKYNCIGIDNYNIHNKEKISSLNELAKHYLLEYERKWSLKEPIYLLGWSLGGQIALEMAAILEGMNYKEIHIFLLDTVLVDKHTVTNSRQEMVRIIQTRNEMLEKYEKGYVESVISSMEAENILASTEISNYLKYTNVALFKASKTEIIAKFNNVDRVAERVEVINLDCSHLEIVEAEALTIANYLLSKLPGDSA
jgi:amino acid adenylation domain-containing protein/non-ribosomal peptide synthase protein (TIGR01720 family)